MEKEPNHKKVPKGLDMYFNRSVAEKFAELEQNEKNYKVAEIVDDVIMSEIKGIQGQIYSAELGGGAHPDRYDKLFSRLLTEPKGHMDWVDISSYMLDLAKNYVDNEKYKERLGVIKFVEDGILEYLEKLPAEKLDLAIMKYTIDHIADLDRLFNLLSEKLKTGGKMVASLGVLDSQLKSISTNARFLYNGEEFPEDEVRILKDGDNFTVKFFKVSGDPKSGYLEGAETIKYYHSEEKIRELANKYKLDVSVGDWKEMLGVKDGISQLILVLRKTV
ncbi:MAG: class I SAM-dependent methyltransferase [Parcubacteria group bacterium]|jgi:ubiquinone/menaquinone biosynthesis C-methylase UbiE